MFSAPVTNSPPKIIQRPPDTKMTVTQGQNLTVECVVEGAPVPVVTWDKYGGHLPEGRYSQLLGKWDMVLCHKTLDRRLLGWVPNSTECWLEMLHCKGTCLKIAQPKMAHAKMAHTIFSM